MTIITSEERAVAPTRWRARPCAGLGFRWLAGLARRPPHLPDRLGCKNRVSALFHWTISFFGRSRLERTITAQQIFARQALAASARGGGLDD
jgi:hypothetical protein